MITERDLIMRLVRQLAELLAAVMSLRKQGRREEALARIDGLTGRLVGMDAGAFCRFGGSALEGVAPELRLPLGCLLRQRAHLLRAGGDAEGVRQAFRTARALVASAPVMAPQRPGSKPAM